MSRSSILSALFALILFNTACKKDTENKLPAADAGPSQTVTYPVESVTLTGTGKDADGKIVTYLWEQVSGPSASVIVDPGAPSTVVDGLVQGTYIFQLSVWDNLGGIGTDTTVVTVSPSVDSVYDITSGMVAYYNFNGGNLNDSSGYGNNIAFNNATTTADRFGRAGNAYLFDGSSSYMQVTNSQSLNPNNITLFAIVKLNGFYAGDCHGNQILGEGAADDVNGFYAMRIQPLNTPCSAPVDTTQEIAGAGYGDNNPKGSAAGAGTDSILIRTGTWYKLAYTYDGTTSKFYINGVLKSTVTKSVPFTSNTFPLVIGKLNDSLFPYWFNGIIDEIRIYNRALPQGAITQLYKLAN